MEMKLTDWKPEDSYDMFLLLHYTITILCIFTNFFCQPPKIFWDIKLIFQFYNFI